MATFTSLDYQDIVDILELDPVQLEPESELRSAGTVLEEQDARLGTDNVAKVQNAISAYKTAEAAYNTAFESDTALGIAEQEVDGEYRIEWNTKGASASKYNNYLAAMRRHKALIRRYLQWTRSNPYSGTVTKSVS